MINYKRRQTISQPNEPFQGMVPCVIMAPVAQPQPEINYPLSEGMGVAPQEVAVVGNPYLGQSQMPLSEAVGPQTVSLGEGKCILRILLIFLLHRAKLV